MRKGVNLFLSVLLILVFFPMNIKAMEEAPIDYGEPIETIIYEDENGAEVIEKIYFVPDSVGVGARAASGSGWYKNEKTYTWDKNGDEKVMRYYAQGYFSWGSGNVTVSSPSSGINFDKPTNVTISNKQTVSGTGKYALIFNKYAYVTFSFTATNIIGMSQDFSVTIRISQSGNNI